MPASLPINFAGVPLILLADRAVHWPDRQTLILADIHLGKDATFRAAGLPVPAGNSAKDLSRIEALLSLTHARRLIVLGDLVHSRTSHQPELADAFEHWRAMHCSLDILLIRGNHDRQAGAVPANWKITEVREPFDAGALLLTHKPGPGEKPLLCGHVHPTIAIQDYDRTFATIPCFVADPMQLMLPAFGSFTGGFKMQPEPARRIYPVTPKSVFRFPPIN